MIVEQSVACPPPPGSRSCSRRSASAPPAPPRRSARTGSRPAGVGAGRILVGGALLVAVALLASGLRALARLPRRPVADRRRARSATYQLSFFAAVADTGVAVGTIVALGSAPALAGALEWAVERRAPARAWAMATALACAGVAMLAPGRRRRGDLAPRRRARALRRRLLRRATRSRPSGCSTRATRPRP